MVARDVYPQWLTLTQVVESAANTFTEAITQMPVRLSARQVVEILGIELQRVGGLINAIDSDLDAFSKIQLSKKSGNVALNSSDLLALHETRITIAAMESTETGAGLTMSQSTVFLDFASGGKGFLFAGQQVHLGVVSGAAAMSVITGRGRILYRIVTVSAEELIGILAQDNA